MHSRKVPRKMPGVLDEQPSPKEQDRSSHLDLTKTDREDLAIWIAAAELRVVTDRRLGKVTPAWVELLTRAKN